MEGQPLASMLLLSGQTRNGQNGLAGFNQASISDFVPPHTRNESPATTQKERISRGEKKKKKKPKGLQWIFTDFRHGFKVLLSFSKFLRVLSLHSKKISGMKKSAVHNRDRFCPNPCAVQLGAVPVAVPPEGCCQPSARHGQARPGRRQRGLRSKRLAPTT